MAVTIEELFGRRLSGGDGELVYIIRGTQDAAEARDAMLDEAPETFHGISRNETSASVEEYEGVSGGAFQGRVQYRTGGPTIMKPGYRPGDSAYSFDISGVPTRILQSKETVSSTTDLDTTPDFGGAINVQDGRVEGVDIIVPEASFSETHIISNAVMTSGYAKAIHDLVGKVNDAPFRGFSAGEVLFIGASGSRRSNEDWEVSFRFAASQNQTSISVGSLTVSSKKGWEYLWALYEGTDETEAGSPIKEPTAAFVERVYDEGDFSALGLS